MTSMVTNALRVTDKQFNTAVEDLKQFVSIRSCSFPNDADYSLEALQNAAEFAKVRLEALGFNTRFSYLKEGTQPYVIAEKIVKAGLPTILLYGHYDVQPVERDKWHTDPFVATIKNNRMYGRGASDDKAGIISILTALKAYQEAGKELPVNVKILFEGDEECGDTLDIGELIKKETKALQADSLIIMDGGNKDVETGTIENCTAGIASFELRVDALAKPTHSGVGKLAPDPCQALAKLITSLADPRSIPGFMDDCTPVTEQDRALLDSCSISAQAYAHEHGVKPGAELRGDPNSSIFYRTLAEPSISIVNMTGGQLGGGNAIQDHARCKFGVRLTAGQDPARIEDVLRKYFASQEVMYNLPCTLEKVGLAAKAWRSDFNRPYAQAMLKSMHEIYGKTAVMPTGGTIPMMIDFEEAIPGVEIIIAGVEDPATAAHSHNESQDLSVLRNTTDSLIAFLEKAKNLPLRA